MKKQFRKVDTFLVKLFSTQKKHFSSVLGKSMMSLNSTYCFKFKEIGDANQISMS